MKMKLNELCRDEEILRTWLKAAKLKMPQSENYNTEPEKTNVSIFIFKILSSKHMKSVSSISSTARIFLLNQSLQEEMHFFDWPD